MNKSKASDNQERLERFGKDLTKQANETRRTIAHQIKATAKNLRSELKDHDELDDNLRKQADEALQRLDEVAVYLDDRSVEEIEEGARKAIQQNVWRSLLIAFVIGFVLGILIKRD